MEKTRFTGRGRRLIPACLAAAALLWGAAAGAQSPLFQLPAPNVPRNGNGIQDNTGPFASNPQQEQKRINYLNSARQKALVSDTQKLLKLTRELNEEISGAHSTSLTEGQLRKLGEIAKLAKSVKEKMSFGVGAFPNTEPPPLMPIIK